MAEKQKVLWFQENRYVDRVKMPVELGKYLVHKDLTWKWQRMRELCFQAKGIGSGLYMVIDSRWSLPITPYKELVPESTLAKLTDEFEEFHSSFNDTKEISEIEKRKANIEDLLIISILVAVVGLVFFFLVTGKLF